MNSHHLSKSQPKNSKMVRNTDTAKYLKWTEHILNHFGKNNENIQNTIARIMNIWISVKVTLRKIEDCKSNVWKVTDKIGSHMQIHFCCSSYCALLSLISVLEAFFNLGYLKCGAYWRWCKWKGGVNFKLKRVNNIKC